MLHCMYSACVVYVLFLCFDLLKEFFILRPCYFRLSLHIYLSDSKHEISFRFSTNFNNGLCYSHVLRVSSE